MRGVESGLTGGAVGVAGVDGDHAYLAAGSAQVLLVHDQRRGGDAVGRRSVLGSVPTQCAMAAVDEAVMQSLCLTGRTTTRGRCARLSNFGKEKIS